MFKPKIFFYITCSSFALFVLWLQLSDTPNFDINDDFNKEAIQHLRHKLNSIRRSQMSESSDDLKYMLIWNHRNLAPLDEAYFRSGQESFISKKCPFTNCFVTSDRNYFGGDLTKFDAIAFNGRNVTNLPENFPRERSSHQKYIYFNMESADNFPVCDPAFDDFFNWTATYKLDSDIPFPYVLIRQRKDGNIVGPGVNMDWPAEFPDYSDYLSKFDKSKAGAWFVSHCRTRSKREDVVSKLQEALSDYGYSIDIYGRCGTFDCPREDKKVCNDKLKKDYYFYFSMENSFSEDYVTEKLVTALQHDVVPIVYGGADYSRFLPPNSYIDAQDYDAPSLAAFMDELIRTPALYAEYFRWKQYYVYGHADNVCKVCTALNDKEMFSKKTVYKEFRQWWFGSDDFMTRC